MASGAPVAFAVANALPLDSPHPETAKAAVLKSFGRREWASNSTSPSRMEADMRSDWYPISSRRALISAMGFKCESSCELWTEVNQIASEAKIPKWRKLGE